MPEHGCGRLKEAARAGTSHSQGGLHEKGRTEKSSAISGAIKRGFDMVVSRDVKNVILEAAGSKTRASFQR